jgi:hypothetical protein
MTTPQSKATAGSEREAFEAWASDQGFVLTRTVHGDDYQDLRTQGPWDAWQARAPQPSGAAGDRLPFAILADELEALHRFYETTEDGQDYDVPVPMMKRLAVIGLVRRVTGNRYEFTDFGLSVRNGDFADASLASPSSGGWNPGYALAMRVLQSDLYHELDDKERADCDALLARLAAPKSSGESHE